MRIKVLLNSGSTINEGRLAKGGDKLSPSHDRFKGFVYLHRRRVADVLIRNGILRKAKSVILEPLFNVF